MATRKYYSSTSARNTTKQDDIGNKHIQKIMNVGEPNESQYFYQFRTIDFSCDVLQYLINNNCFNITTENTNTKNTSASGNSSKDKILYKLSINNLNIPILHYIKLYEFNFPKLIVNIKIKNLFDALYFLISDRVFKEDAASITNSDIPVSIEKYNSYITKSKDYYWNILNNRITGELKISISSNDRSGDKFVYPIPCISEYGLDSSKLKGISEEVFKSDFIASIYRNSFLYLYDFVMKKYNKAYVPIFSTEGINTFLINETGDINEDIITLELPIKGKPNSIYLIIGHNSHYYNQCNYEFPKLERYDEILKDQHHHYEEWLREYTFQEIKEKLSKGELSPEDVARIKSPADITFADYILNKKKIAGVDFDYMDKMKMLNPDEKTKLMGYLRMKINKMCENKFNKPNTKLIYKWEILEVTFNPSDPNTRIPVKVEYAINTIREVNQNHTELFTQIQKLCRNEMLKRNGIPIDDKENVEYKQVFTETSLDYCFYLESYYIHPLDYKINYYYRENKIITLEELIECSKLTCDGLYPGMEKYRGIPFYAVVPLEITNFCNILNSVHFINEKGITCNLNDTNDPIQSIRRNNKLTRVNSRNGFGNKSSFASFASLGSRTSRMIKNSTSSSLTQKKSNTSHTGNTKNTRNTRNTRNTSKTENDNVLDRTVFIPKITDNRPLLEPERLFRNKDIKVYSSLITNNGLIFAILLDTSNPADKKFYYILLENDLSGLQKLSFNSASNLNNTQNIHKIKKYVNDGFMDVGIYGTTIPLVNIYLIKEFVPGDKVFTTLGNECIYKTFANMDEFYKQDRIELPVNDFLSPSPSPSPSPSGQIESIPNFYRYFLIQILNMINSMRVSVSSSNGSSSISNFFDDKLTEKGDKPGLKKYYRIMDGSGIRMISESELYARPELRRNIYFEGISNLNEKGEHRNETNSILEPILNNNNIFITIGKEVVMIINKFPEDELKTKYIPPQKRQLEKFFKFTAWIISKEYILKCLEILREHERNPNASPLVNIDNIIKDKTIFHITSLEKFNVDELAEHIEEHKNYVKEFIIAKDTYLCKNEYPILTVNPFSDISSSVLHFHFQQDIIHTLALKIMNNKYELLKNKNSIFDFQSNAYRVNKIINKIKTNKHTIIYSLLNPYVPSIKLSSILALLN